MKTRIEKHHLPQQQHAAKPQAQPMGPPDVQEPDFAKECCRQSRLAAQTDKDDTHMQHLMDQALAELDGWTE